MKLLRQIKTLVQQRWPLLLVALGLLLTLWSLLGDRQPDNATTSASGNGVLEILTWEGYPPRPLVEAFVEATSINVELGVLADTEQFAVALNEPERRRYDLVALPLEQVRSLLAETPLLQPIERDRLAAATFLPPLAEIAADYSTLDGEVYALPNVWGTTGLIANRAALDAAVTSYQDLCAPANRDRVSYRPALPSLAAAAYGLGLEPFEFAAANPDDTAGWEQILSQAYDYLAACDENVHAYWRDRNEQVQLMLSEAVTLAEGWDWTAWTLQRQNPDIEYVVPSEGLLGWLDVFAIPADGDNLDAAYAWLDFVMQPEIAALVLQETGTMPAVSADPEQLEEEFQPLLTEIYGEVDLSTTHWLPPRSPALQVITDQYIEQLNALAARSPAS
ncbi:MAG: extracellular solute-binding protein [Spirulinaceae cyanobacterium SM2_1_0]|nr:extracellular solute-binding protein [Spirulinaceae cyanobacterium SM2_1_0]